MSTALARLTDPNTSAAAAAHVNTGELELIVRRTLAMHPAGLTTREMHVITGVDLVSLSPRMKPLEQKGFVLRTAERRDGSTVWCSVFVDPSECDHPDGLLVYVSEWPGFFDRPSLHTCAGCKTSLMRAAPAGGLPRISMNDARGVA